MENKMTKETKEKQDYFLMDELPIETQTDIRNAMIVQSKLGKKKYRNVWVGSGWISLDSENRLTFREAKY
tara:strand:+ start:46 stop:255 length:210 start_codon:yes stop_codon:yes gene_type:complete